MKCANHRQDHPANSRSCDIYKVENEIFEVKHKKNINFAEARKIVGSCMGENSYTSVVWKVGPIRQSSQNSKYKVLVEKLTLLEPKHLPKFKKRLKNIHLTELQTQPRPVGANKKKANETTKVKLQTNSLLNHKLLQKTKNHEQNNSYRLPIQPLTSTLDNSNFKLNCDKHECPHHPNWIIPYHHLDKNDWRSLPSQIKLQRPKTDLTF